MCKKRKKEVDVVKIIRIEHFVSKSKCINKYFMFVLNALFQNQMYFGDFIGGKNFLLRKFKKKN
jgi:hypothetical protein